MSTTSVQVIVHHLCDSKPLPIPMLTRVGVNSIPELELQLNSNSNSGIGIGIGIEISGIENGIGIEIPGIGIGIGIENRNWIFCNCTAALTS